jgi:serine/threonine-protein kinase
MGAALRFGPYTAQRVLHESRTGKIYRGLDPSGAAVAIKTVDPRLSKNPRQHRERFLRGVRAALTARSPHLLTIFDAGADRESGHLWCAMELFDGERLSERCTPRPGAAIDQTFAVLVSLQVARALKALHDIGVVHRNVKPANALVMLRNGFDPFVKLVGMSLVKLSEEGGEEITRRGEVIGTPAYLAPEALLDSSSVSPSADVYSLGVLLCELGGGELPFVGESLIEQLIAKQEQKPSVKLRSDLRPYVRRMLSVQPQERPPLAQVIAALEDAVEITRSNA